MPVRRPSKPQKVKGVLHYAQTCGGSSKARKVRIAHHAESGAPFSELEWLGAYGAAVAVALRLIDGKNGVSGVVVYLTVLVPPAATTVRLASRHAQACCLVGDELLRNAASHRTTNGALLRQDIYITFRRLRQDAVQAHEHDPAEEARKERRLQQSTSALSRQDSWFA